jgi:hypothetical protein
VAAHRRDGNITLSSASLAFPPSPLPPRRHRTTGRTLLYGWFPASPILVLWLPLPCLAPCCCRCSLFRPLRLLTDVTATSCSLGQVVPSPPLPFPPPHHSPHVALWLVSCICSGVRCRVPRAPCCCRCSLFRPLWLLTDVTATSRSLWQVLLSPPPFLPLSSPAATASLPPPRHSPHVARWFVSCISYFSALVSVAVSRPVLLPLPSSGFCGCSPT